MTVIAFLGLGHMGLPMAQNLVEAGHDVVGFDVVPAAMDAARAAGLSVATGGAEAVANAEVVITMFPAGAHVLAAYPEPPGGIAGECSVHRLVDDRRGRRASSARPRGRGGTSAARRSGVGRRRGRGGGHARLHGRR